MKLALLLLISFTTSAFSNEIPKTIDDILSKHCKLGSKVACDLQKCSADPKTCPDPGQINKEQQKAMEEAFVPILEKCKNDAACFQKESEIASKKEAEKLKPLCASGNKDSCFMIEYNEAMQGLMKIK